MKTITLAFFILFLSTNLIAQNPFYDAMFLKDSINENGKIILNKIIQELLAKYFQKDSGSITAVMVDDNPFLKKLFRDKGADAEDVSSLREGMKSFSLAGVGGLDVTNIANGISQFMIKRAKEELTIAFFERFRKFAEENPEFEVLFPKTTNNLENLLTYKYPEFLPALRVGFFEDIKGIPYHLDDVLELPRYQSLLKDLPEVKVAIRTVRLVYELESGNSHAADMLAKFAAFREWNEDSTSNDFKNFGSSVKLASIFSQSLRNDKSVSGSSRAWVTYAEMDSLVSNDTTFRIYLGLVYQLVMNDNIQFYTELKGVNFIVIRFDSLMGAQKDNLFLFRNKVTEFIELAGRVDKVLDTIQVQSRRKLTPVQDAFYDYVDVSLDVIDYALSIGQLFSEKLEVGHYTLIARSANDLYRNIYKEEYTQAISNVVDILQHTKSLIGEMQNDATESDIEAINSLPLKTELNKKNPVENLTRKDIVNIEDYLGTVKIKSDTILKLEKIKSLYYWDKLDSKFLKISQYGLFMANMANAQSPQEVASILDNATLPVGSSSIKKNSKTNVAIQSYLGPFVRFGEIDNTNAWTSQFGVTAPIGIAFSKGLNNNCGAISLFIPLLDVGAIVDYQLKMETITTPDSSETTTIHKDYEVQLGQIFSPGAYLVYGFPWRLPLSFGIGGQYGPGLGKIEDDNDVVINNPGWRWNAFLAVDIPLFNLANTPREK